jgi:hypothetical protein
MFVGGMLVASMLALLLTPGGTVPAPPAPAPAGPAWLPVSGLLFNAFTWGVSWWPFRRLEALGLHPLWATALIYLMAVLFISAWRPASWAQLLRAPLLEALGIEVDRRVVAEATRQDPVAQVLQRVEPAAAAADQEMEVGALELAVERLLADLELGRHVELAGAEALGQKQAQHRHRVDLGGELDAVPAPLAHHLVAELADPRPQLGARHGQRLVEVGTAKRPWGRHDCASFPRRSRPPLLPRSPSSRNVTSCWMMVSTLLVSQ